MLYTAGDMSQVCHQGCIGPGHAPLATVLFRRSQQWLPGACSGELVCNLCRELVCNLSTPAHAEEADVAEFI